MDKLFEGKKRAFVTGGGTGIGRASAMALGSIRDRRIGASGRYLGCPPRRRVDQPVMARPGRAISCGGAAGRELGVRVLRRIDGPAVVARARMRAL